MENQKFNIEVNTNKQILSSEAKICKTESFFYQTRKLENIDKLILKIGESVLLIEDEIIKQNREKENVNAFLIGHIFLQK